MIDEFLATIANLFDAVSRRRTDTIQQIIEDGSLASVSDNHMSILVASCVENGLAEVLEHLSEAGCDLNVTNRRGQTLLQLAVLAEEYKTLKVLLDLGIDPNSRGEDGGTALHALANTKIPLSKAHGNTLLGMAKLLLERGVKPHLRDKKGKTALEYALHNEYEQLVELLTREKKEVTR